jgi:hypothetical protein
MTNEDKHSHIMWRRDCLSMLHTFQYLNLRLVQTEEKHKTVDRGWYIHANPNVGVSDHFLLLSAGKYVRRGICKT